MSHHAFILKHQFQITTFIRELKSHKEGLQLSKKRVRKSSHKFNRYLLLWLDWILFNATIYSSDMITALKRPSLVKTKLLVKTNYQILVKIQAKSVIRGYGYNGDMKIIALKRLKQTFENQTKNVTSFLQRINWHPISTLERPDSFTVFSNI